MGIGSPSMRSGNNAEKIVLAYGDRQTFRYRCEDIHFAGFTALTLPTRRSEWRLNGGAPTHFYVERQTTAADPRCYPRDTRTPAVIRLLDLPGHFNIEIPVRSPQLRAGHNRIALAIEGQDGVQAQLEAAFTWDPSAPGLPLDRIRSEQNSNHPGYRAGSRRPLGRGPRSKRNQDASPGCCQLALPTRRSSREPGGNLRCRILFPYRRLFCWFE